MPEELNVAEREEQALFAHILDSAWLYLPDPAVPGSVPATTCCADAMFHMLRAYLRTMPYPAYLQTEWWQEQRQFALERAKHRCQLCNGENGSLNVHHRTYERRGHERPEDLIVLCRPCHAKFHNKLP